MKWMGWKLTATGLLLLSIGGCRTHSIGFKSAVLQDPGKQWLSWNEPERNDFVYAYTQGYEAGMYQACKAVNDLSQEDDLHNTGGDYKPHMFPYSRCRSGVGEYSSFKMVPSADPDFHAYTSIITEFYSKHPEYRNIPSIYLMQFLTDKEHKTADQLYVMANGGEMRTHW